VKASPGVGRAYAKALFELARERDLTDAVARELDALVDLLAREPALRSFLAVPWVAAGSKRRAAGEVATRLGMSTLTRDFLALVAGKGRAAHLGAIASAYRSLMDDAAGRVRARVRVAAALSEAERGMLAERLGTALGGRQVVLEELEDPALLGGFVAEIGSVLVDGSLDGQLARMRERMARGQA